MFSYLYNTIFPFLFDFASKLVGLANLPLEDFQQALQLGQSIPYTNLLTGEQLSMFMLNIDGNVANLFIELLTFGVPNSAPLWVALLLASINGFIIISIIKFLLDIVL